MQCEDQTKSPGSLMRTRQKKCMCTPVYNTASCHRRCSRICVLFFPRLLSRNTQQKQLQSQVVDVCKCLQIKTSLSAAEILLSV